MLRAFFQQHFRGVGIGESVASTERVLQMKMDFVFVAQPGSRAAWAGCAGESVISRLSRTTTLPAAANSIAARSPATPAPITSKSVSAGGHFINAECYHATSPAAAHSVTL